MTNATVAEGRNAICSIRPQRRHPRRPRWPALARVRDLLHEHMGANIGLDELVDRSGIDRFRLTRLFQREFGTSSHAYLVRLRLRAARRLLAAGRTPARVAAEVGFADQSHLGRWFRRAYRMTPATYRRMCEDGPD